MKRDNTTSPSSAATRKRTISLGRESLRVLSALELPLVAGGTGTSIFSMCGTDCRKTL
jgi:hypothetical protein